jgi:hypothetical protein
MALLTRLAKKLNDWLNGDGGRPSPLGKFAPEIALGDRMDNLADLGDDESGKGADLIPVPDPGDDLTGDKTVGGQIRALAAGGGGGGVTSFNTRTGAVVPVGGDYTAGQVGADPAGTAASAVSTHAGASSAHDSQNVDYDNTVSGLTATDVKAAIDEVAASAGADPAYEANATALDSITGLATVNSMSVTPAAGDYTVQFDAETQKAAGGNTTLTMGIYKNGVLVAGSTRNSNQTTDPRHTGCGKRVNVNGTDVIDIRASAGATVNFLGRTLTLHKITAA